MADEMTDDEVARLRDNIAISLLPSFHRADEASQAHARRSADALIGPIVDALQAAAVRAARVAVGER